MKRIDKIITKLVLLVLFTTSNISVYAQTEEDIKDNTVNDDIDE